MKKIVTKIGQVLFYALAISTTKPLVKKEEIDRQSLAYINDNVADDKVIIKAKVISYPRWYLPFYWLLVMVSFFVFIFNGGLVAFIEEIKDDFSKDFDGSRKAVRGYVIETYEPNSIMTNLYISYLFYFSR